MPREKGEDVMCFLERRKIKRHSWMLDVISLICKAPSPDTATNQFSKWNLAKTNYCTSLEGFSTRPDRCPNPPPPSPQLSLSLPGPFMAVLYGCCLYWEKRRGYLSKTKYVKLPYTLDSSKCIPSTQAGSSSPSLR